MLPHPLAEEYRQSALLVRRRLEELRRQPCPAGEDPGHRERRCALLQEEYYELLRLYRHLVCQAEGSSQSRLDPQFIAIQTANFTPGFFDSFTIRFP